MKSETSIIKSAFICIRDGLTIRGMELRPQGTNLPIAIVSHGFTQNQKHIIHYAEQFAKWGYAAYCFDFAGALFGKSDGYFEGMSTVTQKRDLKKIIKYARQQSYTNPQGLLLMGCDHGGLVSALTAAELEEDVSKLILFYTSLSILNDTRKEEKTIFAFDPKNMFEDLINGSKKSGHETIDMQVLEKISKYPGPILMVHGSKDKNVAADTIKKVEEAYLSAGSECHLHIIQGAKHEFSKKADRTAISFVQKFLSKEE